MEAAITGTVESVSGSASADFIQSFKVTSPQVVLVAACLNQSGSWSAPESGYSSSDISNIVSTIGSSGYQNWVDASGPHYISRRGVWDVLSGASGGIP